MKVLPGVSMVICCYNSEERLPRTLAHLLAQDVTTELPWEIIVVDNASQDATTQVAQAATVDRADVSVRVVREPEQGLAHARRRGLSEARYEIVSFIDDDNWVPSDWVMHVAAIMAEHPEVGVCGGSSVAVVDRPFPPWFTQYQAQYAVGEQAGAAGDVTWEKGWLWGAGLSVRRSAWLRLVQEGYRPRLRDRTGNSLTAGADVELCHALRLAGWQLWYEPDLQLQHFIPAQRLEWSYLRRLNRGFGRASVGLSPYRLVLKGSPDQLKGRFGRIWMWQLKDAVQKLFQHRTKVFMRSVPSLEGEVEVLAIERLLGRVQELLEKRRAYDQAVYEIYSAPWRRV